MNQRTDVITYETPEQIVTHISRLMDEAEAMLVGPTVDQSDEEMGEIRLRLEAIESKLAVFYGKARRHFLTGARLADEAICAHPYRSLALALGAGVILGVCLRRGAA